MDNSKSTLCKDENAMLDYVSISCSRCPHCCAWGRNGIVAYGAHQVIALVDSQADSWSGSRVFGALNGHSGRVNCVKWIEPQGGGHEFELVSGSVDKTLIVWRVVKEQGDIVCKLPGHSDVVTSVSSLTLCDGHKTWLASASADNTVKIWLRASGEDSFTCVQTIDYKRNFVLDVSFAALPAVKAPILACAVEDCKIHLWCLDAGDQFKCAQLLVGHEDWVCSLNFALSDDGKLLLASSAQDNFIRIWQISIAQPLPEPVPGEVPEIRLRENTFTVQDVRFAATLEAVLLGHEHRVYSICWQPSVMQDGQQHQPLCLLSASMDKTMILWKPDADSGVWLDQVRVGDVGGNTLGFYGAVFSPSGTLILGHGFQGEFHLWKETSTKWEPQSAVSGHFGPVQDVAWSPEGFLVSVSQDQTSRLHSVWRQPDKLASWHEIARPQVHGYDMQCLAMTQPFQFASGADEKVIRVFDAAGIFHDNLAAIMDRSVSKSGGLPAGASVPSLGLSNKAVFEDQLLSQVEEDQDSFSSADVNQVPSFNPAYLKAPPVEEDLLQNTLWPETQKLYGHGYELFCLASNGQWLASTCKASKPEHAAIFIWDAVEWKCRDRLAVHQLTVTQLSFSHHSDMLLAVSRDRTWSLWTLKSSSDGTFELVAHTDKTTALHSRIIWSCSWSPDDQLFATASRDKKVYLWSKALGVSDSADCGDGWRVASSAALELSQPATAVDFLPKLIHDRYVLAVGMEHGGVSVVHWSPLGKWQHFRNISLKWGLAVVMFLVCASFQIETCALWCGVQGNDHATASVHGFIITLFVISVPMYEERE